jgi:peptide/nickel transport system substrate-binding protein
VTPIKLVALLATFMLVIAACSSEAEAPEGGNLLILQWQAPSQANALLSSGTKDLLASSLVLEPLVEFAPDGSVIPALAAEVPTQSNGGIPADLMSVTYKLLEGVTWSDGSPFTADDVVFSWEYCADTATGCSNGVPPAVVNVVAVDDLTVTVNFDSPQPFPFTIFAGYTYPVVSRAQFGPCIGAAAAGCTDENFFPMGTGPYMVTEFRAEDTALYEYNPNYRKADLGKPFFATVELKGGGDAEAAARSVLEIGEADYAWNLQVVPEILLPMEAAGNGRIVTSFTADVEHINLNQTNPDGPTPGEFGEDGSNTNPFFYEDVALHDALSLAINRQELVTVGYGSAGFPTCNIWPVGPENSPNNDDICTQDIPRANQILDDAGYLDTDGDGIREKNGLPLSFEFVTSTNAVRQLNQELIKGYWEQIGVETDMQSADAGLFFDGTCAADACIWKFFTDIQMFTNPSNYPDAAGYFEGWRTDQFPTEATAWGGSNISRLNSPEFDALQTELANTALDDPDQDALVHELNDLIVSWNIIPLIHRGNVSGISLTIDGYGDPNGWDSEYWNIEDWTRAG